MPVIYGGPDPFQPQRRMSNRRRYSKKPKNVFKRVRNLEKHVKKIEYDEEVKWTQKANNNVPNDDPIHSTGVLYLLNGTTQGTDANDRIGGMIKCTSVHIKGHIHPVFQGTPTEARLVLFWDRQANGVIPNVQGAFQGAVLDTSSGITPVHAPINMANKDRFHILWDRTYKMVNFSDTDNFTVEPIVIDKYRKLGRKTHYNTVSNVGTIADIISNALYLLVIGNIPSTGLTNPQLSFCAEVRFKDA